MSAPATYDAGNVIVCKTNPPFTQNGATLDPDTVLFVCQKCDGTSIRSTWTKTGGDPSGTIVHVGATNSGTFTVNVVGDVGSGTTPYQYRYYSNGNGQASARGSFFVRPDSLT